MKTEAEFRVIEITKYHIQIVRRLIADNPSWSRSRLSRELYRACSPQRHIVIPMMLRLIYGCGLRISEAIKLRVGDVDLQTGVLLVRAAKFNKDRYVPMAQSLLQCCQNYAARLAVGSNTKSPFLPSPARGLYSKSTIGY